MCLSLRSPLIRTTNGLVTIRNVRRHADLKRFTANATAHFVDPVLLSHPRYEVADDNDAHAGRQIPPRKDFNRDEPAAEANALRLLITNTTLHNSIYPELRVFRCCGEAVNRE